MASQANLLHAEYDVLSSLGGYGARRAGVTGLLTNTQVAAATSAEGLVTILETVPATVHVENEITALNAQAALRRGDALGDFTDARIAAATTVEGLAQLTNAADDADSGHLGPNIV